jgi:hypothetical protein
VQKQDARQQQQQAARILQRGGQGPQRQGAGGEAIEHRQDVGQVGAVKMGDRTALDRNPGGGADHHPSAPAIEPEALEVVEAGTTPQQAPEALDVPGRQGEAGAIEHVHLGTEPLGPVLQIALITQGAVAELAAAALQAAGLPPGQDRLGVGTAAEGHELHAIGAGAGGAVAAAAVGVGGDHAGGATSLEAAQQRRHRAGQPAIGVDVGDHLRLGVALQDPRGQIGCEGPAVLTPAAAGAGLAQLRGFELLEVQQAQGGMLQGGQEAMAEGIEGQHPEAHAGGMTLQAGQQGEALGQISAIEVGDEDRSGGGRHGISATQLWAVQALTTCKIRPW